MVDERPVIDVVPGGIVATRQRVRSHGPLAALVVPGLLLAGAAGCWIVAGGSAGVLVGSAGWVLAALALPTAILLGVPWEGGTARYLGVLITSALVWLLVGYTAARRATRRPVAGWSDYWREYLWLAVALWAGVVTALAAIALALGGLGLA